MIMTKEEAILGSIAKWRRIVAGETKDRGTIDCPLCEMYDANCSECPIGIRTGKEDCRGTPYEQWREHQEVKTCECSRLMASCPVCKSVAEAMLRWLEGLC